MKGNGRSSRSVAADIMAKQGCVQSTIATFRGRSGQAISVTQSRNEPERRRRVPRQLIAWPAAFRIDDGATWSECEVVDISVIGVGIEASSNLGPDLLDRKVSVEVHTPVGAAVTLGLTATIRYVIPRPNGMCRLGGEFIGLSEIERSILETLERMQVAW